jgi:hypothetical protein
MGHDLQCASLQQCRWGKLSLLDINSLMLEIALSKTCLSPWIKTMS